MCLLKGSTVSTVASELSWVVYYIRLVKKVLVVSWGRPVSAVIQFSVLGARPVYHFSLFG